MDSALPMDRRTLLRNMTVGSLAGVSGCLGSWSESSEAAVITDIATEYHGFSTSHILKGTLVENPANSTDVAEREYDESTKSVADLQWDARLEAVNAMVRTQLLTDTDFQIGSGTEVVRYRNQTWNITTLAVWGPQPTHGPRGDPNWQDPVSVDATIDGLEFTLTLRNELDVSLPIHHYGRPYFGVLTAVGSTSKPLQHDRYQENEYIQTEPVIRVDDPADEMDSTNDDIHGRNELGESLNPGETLEETYRLPSDLPDQSQVFFSMPIGDSSIELLDKSGFTPRVHATIKLESDSATPTG